MPFPETNVSKDENYRGIKKANGEALNHLEKVNKGLKLIASGVFNVEIEKEKWAAKLTTANDKLASQNEEKEKRAVELILANEELAFQNKEKENRAAELLIANKELAYQNEEKENRAAELFIANKELAYQNEEKENRAAELIIANKELAYQNEEKENRAAELIIANKELAFQNEEKENRSAELLIANEELAFQNEEKENRAAALVIANKELAFQNGEKEKRAAELVTANKELAFQNIEKEKRAEELAVSTIAEIAASKKAEMHMARLAAIVEYSEDAIVSKSVDGIISSWNKGAEKMFGYSEKEAIGNLISFIIPHEYLEEEKNIISRILNNEKIDHFETVRKKKNGTHFYVSLTVSPLKDTDGSIIGVSKIARDITASKKFEAKILDANQELLLMEKQLKDANKELEAFSYSVSHDLRVPLRAISGYSAMLKEDYANKLDAEANRIINVVVDKTKIMGELIDDLLTFSKMARLEVVSDSIDMKRLAETCMNELLQTEKRTKYDVTICNMPHCKGDASMLKQVWYNLISNALKYSSKKTEAVIEAGAIEDKGMHIFYVKDNGAGFEMKYAKNLFGVFQRLHRQDEFEGTGIGLALAKRIVSKHGGEMWAESTLDKGATFYFSIPKTIDNGQ